MKKLVAVLLCLVTLFLMLSCGITKKEIIIPRDDEESAETSGTKSGEKEENENTGNNSSSSSSSSEPIVTWEIQSALPFSDGVAFVNLVEYENDRYIREYWVAIDPTGKILFELEEKGMMDSWFTPYQNGVKIQYEEYDDWDDIVYDKNGNAVASPEKNGYDEILACQENFRYFIVGKTEQVFSGDRYLIGVINAQGEFIRPLSDTHPISQFMREKGLGFDDIRISCVENDVFYLQDTHSISEFDLPYYHATTDEFTVDHAHFEADMYGCGLYHYDKNGNETMIVSEENYIHAFFDDAVLISSRDYVDDPNFRLIDYEGNVILSFGDHMLSKQSWENSDESPYHYVNGYFLTQVTNATGANYCCLFDKNGELVFEPIRMEGNDHFYALNEKGFVYKHEDSETREKIYYFYNYEGECVQVSNIKHIDDAFNNGLYAVSLENSTEECYVNYLGEVVISGKNITK